MFVRVPGVTSGDRPVYQQVGGSYYLSYWSGDSLWDWRISDSYTKSSRALSSKPTFTTECPEDTAGKTWYHSRDGSTCGGTFYVSAGSVQSRLCGGSIWDAGGVALTCVSPPPPQPPPPPPPMPGWPPIISSASALETGVIVAIGLGGFFVVIISIAACCVVLARRVSKRTGIPTLAKRRGALNAPGAWHFMISYTQRSDRAIALATSLEKDLVHRGYSVWLDVNMNDKSEAAMKEAVENSMVVLALITGGTPNLDDDNAYFKRDFCVQELKWAFAANKYVQPVVRMDDKNNISSFIAMAPGELKCVGNVDFVDLNTTDKSYWRVGIEKILQKAEACGALTVSGAASRRSSRRSSSYRDSRSVAPMPEKVAELTDPTARAPASLVGPASSDTVVPFDDLATSK